MKIVLICLFLLGGLAACNKPLTVEQRVIATIRQMEEKIEAGERRRFMKHFSADFTAQNGRMNRDQAQALVVFQLNRHKRLQAQLFPIRVEETGENSAKASFSALVTGGPQWMPDRGQVYEFETSWRLQDGDWLLQAANWTPMGLEEVL